MSTPRKNPDVTPELRAVIGALELRKAAWHIKSRMLRGIVPELRTARDSGLTMREIWKALHNAGFPGIYLQFCRSANRLLDPDGEKPRPEPKILPGGTSGRDIPQPQVPQATSNIGGKAWKQEQAARQEQVRREAAAMQKEPPKSTEPEFTIPPFRGRE